MKKNLLVLSAVLTLALMAACGGDRGDPVSTGQNATGYGGSLTLGASRANTPVSEATSLPICQILNSELYGLFLRTLNGIANTQQTVDSIPVTRISGRYSGYVQARGYMDLRDDNKTSDFDMRLTFYDFSDSGFVFMGGELNFKGYVADGASYKIFRLVISDGLEFAGNYKGAVEYNTMRLPINVCETLTRVDARFMELKDFPNEGSQTLIHGDTRIRFNPYYRLYDPLDTIPAVCPTY